MDLITGKEGKKARRKERPLVLLAAAMVGLAAGEGAADARQYLIELQGKGPADLAAAVESAGGTLVHDLDPIGAASAISDDPGFSTALARVHGVRSVTADPSVQWLPELDDFEMEELRVIDAGGSPSGDGHVGPPDAAAFFPCQWNLTQIDAPGAWDQGQFGAGATVAVIDSGVSGDPAFGGGLPHVDMTGQLVGNVTMVSMDEPTCTIRGAFDSASPLDYRFHGTMVAGLIAARGMRVAGVAPDARIFGIKVLNCRGGGTFGDAIAAILFAADQPEIDVINMSFGAYFAKNEPGAGPLLGALNKAVNHAGARGKLVVSSAGNEASDLDHDRNFVRLPAQAGSGISAWAGDIDGNLASYSNHGRSAVWVGAGGGDLTPESPSLPLAGCPLGPFVQDRIASVCSPESIFRPVCANGTFVIFGFIGTSFSAPLVSGVAALSLGAHGPMSRGQLKTHLKNTADDLGKKGADPFFSHGRVNARSAVAP